MEMGTVSVKINSGPYGLSRFSILFFKFVGYDFPPSKSCVINQSVIKLQRFYKQKLSVAENALQSKGDGICSDKENCPKRVQKRKIRIYLDNWQN